MKVTRITGGETWQCFIANNYLRKEGQLRLVEFEVLLDDSIPIEDLSDSR